VNFTGTGTSYSWTNDDTSINLGASGTGPIAPFVATNAGTSPVTATITITPKYTFGPTTCTGPTKTFTITVQPTPAVTAIADQELCNGSSTTAVTFAGTATGFTWTNDTPSIGLPSSGTGNIAAFTAVNNGTSPVTATITVTPSFGACNGSTTTFTYVVNPNPTFTATNNAANICSGGSANISFTSPTAGHRINVVSVNYGAVTGGTVIPGTTTFTNGTSLIEALANNTTAPIDVVYTFNVTTPLTTPACPVAPVNQVITVRVQPTPAFSTVNGAAQICSGSQASITLNSSVTGAQIRLQSVSYGTASGTLSAGALYNPGQQLTEVLTNNTNAAATVTYVFEAIVGSCGPSATQSVQVIVNPNPTFVATNNASQICSGTATNIAFTSSTTGHQINVVSATYGSVTGGTLLPGTTTFVNGNSLTETLTNNTNAPIDVVYVFNVTTPGTTPSCPLSPTSQSVTVRVLPAPTFSLVNGAGQICSGSQSNITLNTSVSGAQIRLKTVNYGAVTGTLSPGVVFSNGQQITEVLANNTNAPVTISYTFEAIVGACTPSATQVTSVTVNPNPSFTATNNSPTICSNTATNISFASSTAGHQINVVSVNYGSVTGGTVTPGTTTFTNGSTLAETLVNGTNNPINVVYTFNITTPSTTPSCPLVTTNQVVTVTVQPSPSFTATNNAPLFCSGNQTNILLNTPTAGAQIRLAAVNYGAASGTLSSGALYTNGQRISEVLTNSTNAPVTVVYTFEAVVTGCSPSAQQVVNVTVDPIPTLATNLNLQELCETQMPTLVLTNPNNVGGTLYTWTISTTNVTGAANQPTPVAASAINTSLSLSSGTIGTITYNVRAVANGCFSTPESIQVTVRRQPTVSVPPNVTQCEPNAIPLNGTIGGGASTALWSVITGAGTLSSTAIVAGAPIAANATYGVNASDIASSVTMRLTTNDPDGPSGLCVAVFADYTIAINRSAKVDAGPDLAHCEDVSGIALQGSASFAPSTQWSLVTGAGTFSDAASPTSIYSFADPSERGATVTLKLTASDPDGAGPGGPCGDVSDLMTVKINKLPVVNYVGFPDSHVMAENNDPIPLTGNQIGGNFSIMPATSVIGVTIQDPTDVVEFDPGIVDIGLNTVTYTYTDPNGCTNTDVQNVVVNPVTTATWGWGKNAAGQTVEALVPAPGVYEICANQGKVELLGLPPPSDGFPGASFFGMHPDSVTGRHHGGTVDITLEGGKWYLNTDGVISDSYRIGYFYTDAIGTPSDPSYFAVHVNAAPIPVINVPNSCVADLIQFNDGSSLPPTDYESAMDAWRWDFGNGTFSEFQNPSYGYITPGFYDIKLTVRTNVFADPDKNLQVCSASTTKTIRVGDVPVVAYNWSALCNNDKTKFEDSSTSGISTITNYRWDFGDGKFVSGPPNDPIIDPSGATIGTFKKPSHAYEDPGKYDVKLTINTEDGCENSLIDQVSIFPYITVTPNAADAYEESFESNAGGWRPEALLKEKGITNKRDSIRYSWVRNNPATTPTPGFHINSASDGNYAWWTGGRRTTDPYGTNSPRYVNPDSYFKSESSAVNGPCFNLMELTRPMISLDYWSDTESNRDGAVIQYSIDGGFNWELLGPLPGLAERDEGINWYNSQGIIGKPGNQRAAGDYGWSGQTNGWLNARFNLDMIDPTMRGQVRLRIAFGSEDDNSGSFDGFAFDNVFIGNKTRNVLVEHFTSIDGGSLSSNNYINGLYDDQVTMRALYGGESDFNSIQYHVASGTFDQLNKDNLTDPATRALFMGVPGPPTTLMDGLRSSVLTGDYLDINKVEIDRRALKDPEITIELDTIPIPSSVPEGRNKIQLKMDLVTKRAFTSPLLLNVALIEDVGPHLNVLRKLLWGPDGITITNSLVQGESVSRDKGIVEIDVPITNPNGLRLIAFVQDKTTREIYQTLLMDAPYKVGRKIVGLEDEGSEESIITRNVKVFPNPANNKFYFGLPDNIVGDNYKWKVSDQRGVIVRDGDFTGAVGNQIEVDVAPFAAGMYIIVIEGPDKSVAYHKLMILHHH
jgi:hypothetical protein